MEDLESKILDLVAKGDLTVEEAREFLKRARAKGEEGSQQLTNLPKKSHKESHTAESRLGKFIAALTILGLASILGYYAIYVPQRKQAEERQTRTTQMYQLNQEYQQPQSAPQENTEQRRQKELEEKNSYLGKHLQDGLEKQASYLEERQVEERIYGGGEWVQAARHDLEWKVNRVYQRRINQYEVWKAAGLGTQGISEEEVLNMQTKWYYDFNIVEITVRGTTNEPSGFDLDWFKVYYPYECGPYVIDYTILKILNRTEAISREVTQYTYTTCGVPFLTGMTLRNDGTISYAPTGIVRIGLDKNALVEVYFE